MAKMIQIRNVPETLHRKLKARAAMEGMSLSDYLLEELRLIARQPSVQEWLRQLEIRSPVKSTLSSADLIREGRGPLPK